MFKHPRLLLTPPSVAAFVIALSLCSCATFTEPSSQVRLQQLEDAHLAFIKHYTCVNGKPATWDQASFDSDVTRITQQFTDAEAAESKAVPARKEFIRKQHCLSPSFAANKTKQLEQNYNLFLHQPSN